MPAKRTFPSIRVRGLAQFDSALSSKGKPVLAYKHYVARVQNEGDQITSVQVFENTLGGEVVWTRDAQGLIRGRLAGAFPVEKTVCFTNLLVNTIGDELVAPAKPVDPGTVEVQLINASYNHVDGGYFIIEIRVYP